MDFKLLVRCRFLRHITVSSRDNTPHFPMGMEAREKYPLHAKDNNWSN